MTYYRLVAYHRTKTERESLDMDRSLAYLKATAVNVDPVKYKNYDLVIEDTDGNAVSRFTLQETKFVEVTEEGTNV